MSYGASHLLADMPEFVERVYGAIIFPLFRPLSLATGLVPVGVFDVLLIAYALWLTVLLVRAIRDSATRRRRWRNALLGGTRRVIRDTGTLVCVFYFAWGFNYARRPIEQRLGWPAARRADASEAVVLAKQAVAAVNRAYLDLHGMPDSGWPTALPANTRELEAAMDEGWGRAVELLQLPPAIARRYGRAKFPWSGRILSRLGISGLYVPFTAETYLPAELPAMNAAFSMQHEKAHQRGIASEAEASFLAVIAGAMAPHPLARYGASQEAAERMLRVLMSRAPKEYRRVQSNMLPGVQRDIDDVEGYFSRNANVTQRWHRALNDRYLRANRVSAGRSDYGRATLLLLAFARQQGGMLLPDSRIIGQRLR